MTVTRSSDQLSTSVALRAELCAAELLPSSARKSCAKSFAKRIGHWTVAVFFALSIATPVAAYVRIEENQNSRTIHIFGTFLPQDFNRLDGMLEQMEKRRPLTDITVTLDSTGGAHVEGVRLGLLLHRKGIGTQIMPGATCFSACAAIFFGGFDRKTGKPNRVAHEGSRLGVHRSYCPAAAAKSIKMKVIAALSQLPNCILLTCAFLKRSGVCLRRPRLRTCTS